ncbi:MAG TPA: UpxY family transcription antiterminator, partial [Pirellula sp.]|nr:UpxY family transcription antiterminator [Pirellula sp.]
MPLLKPEQDIWPLHLLDDPNPESSGILETMEARDLSGAMHSESIESRRESASGNLLSTTPVLANAGTWWALYTLARFEKKLMRQLLKIEVPFYGPTIARRYRSPQGRIRTSVEPLFPNYVFIMGDEMARYKAVSTGSVSRCMPVANPAE